MKKRYGNSTVMGMICGTESFQGSKDCPNNPQQNINYDCECSFDGNAYCELAKGDQPWCDFYTFACQNLEKGNVMYDYSSYGVKSLLVDEDAALLYIRAEFFNHLAVTINIQHLPKCFNEVFTHYSKLDQYVQEAQRLTGASYLSVFILSLFFVL